MRYVLVRLKGEFIMEKVLLVTIQDYDNYGNRLQNYALQTVIASMGYEVYNLTVGNETSKHAQVVIGFFLRWMLVTMGKKRYTAGMLRSLRLLKAYPFTKKLIRNIIYVSREELSSHDWSDFKLVVTGSDQVWHNWERIPDELDYFYLQFVDKNKRASYAPSFGFHAFPESDIDSHIRGLTEMRFLSCREEEGCSLIFQLVNRKAKHVLDPTLLLSKNEWEEIEKKPSFVHDDKFVLTYFLGDVQNHKEAILCNIESPKPTVYDLYHETGLGTPKAVSPSEFLWLVHHATYVYTDSFHAVAFSLIFDTNFCVFKREGKSGKMFSRINELLSLISATNAIYSGTISPVPHKYNIDNLKLEIKESKSYLKDALGQSST